MLAGQFVAGSEPLDPDPATLPRSSSLVEAPSLAALSSHEGISRLCGSSLAFASTPISNSLNAAGTPAGMRSWEPVPGVVRSDGLDSFHLEVDANGPVRSVVLQGETYFFRFRSGGGPPFVLRDDGLNGDRVAGDYIFTSEALVCNTSVDRPAFLWGNTNSPAGLFIANIAGQVEIVELGGQTNRLLVGPYAGILDPGQALRSAARLSSDIFAGPHVVNIRTEARATQQSLRAGNALATLTRPILNVLPDVFDFFMFFSTDHLEFNSSLDSRNFVVGSHYSSRINFAGSGQAPMDGSSAYGSGSTLAGLNIIDAFETFTEYMTHELVHQWAAFLPTSLGLTDGTGHYERRSNLGSFVGGGNWLEQHNGTFIRDCDYPPRAPALDRYLMGLLDSSRVAPLKVNATFVRDCGGVISNITRTVSLAEIQAVVGSRTPGPATSQRAFSLAFVAETYGRFLTPTELTFYDILAEHYTAIVPANAPDPGMTTCWAPITRYFGEGTTWRSDILGRIQPTVTSIQLLAGNRIQLSGTGYPGFSYSLQAADGLAGWVFIGGVAAAPNGIFSVTLTNQAGFASRFYRLSRP